MFGAMTRREWMKYGDKRPDALRSAIKNGDAVPDVDGKSLEIANSKENMNAITNFMNSKDTVFILKLKNGKTVVSNKIGKSPLFGGKGKGGGATGNTADGESLQCLYLAAMFGEGMDKEFSHFTPEVLKKYARNIQVDTAFEKMMGADSAWHISAYVSGQALYKKGYVSNSHIFHRGSKTMDAIYAMKKIAFKNDKSPALNNDKWNPGDIWAVKKGVTPTSVLDSSSVAALNASIKDAFLKRTIVGISLKQINKLTKTAKLTDYNLESGKLGVHRYTKSSLKSNKPGKTFWTFKGGYIFFDSTNKMDVRAPTAMGALNVEIIGKGARGGRAGYGAIVFAAEKFLKVKLPSNEELKSMAKLLQGGRNERLAKNLYNKVKRIHPEIGWDDFWKEMKEATPDRLHANLGATEIIHAVDKANSRDRNAFVSFLVNKAGSKTDESSVYVKVESS